MRTAAGGRDAAIVVRKALDLEEVVQRIQLAGPVGVRLRLLAGGNLSIAAEWLAECQTSSL